LKAATRHRLVDVNPFADLKSTDLANRERDYFVSIEETRKVLEVMPNAQWRILFALARFGGLRVPSEVLALRWGDVDWERNRFLVHSSKTEHHDGKETRLVPIFPELRPHLSEAFDLAEPGTEFVITIVRSEKKNFRTRMERIIQRAGLQPWEKLFQNLRSSRETELCEQFPLHVVCEWIGNSQIVAAKHYLQIRDSDYDRAAGVESQKSAANSL